jgi:arylsulfatase A-like enzyme
MSSLLSRIAALRVPRSAVGRALAVAGPLSVSLVLTKILKLATAGQDGAGTLVWAVYQFVVEALRGTALTLIVFMPLLFGWAGAIIARRKGQRRLPWAAGAIAAYLAVMLAVVFTSGRNSLEVNALAEARSDAIYLGVMWWRDVLVTVLALVALSGHFMLVEKRRAHIRSVVIWSLVALGYALAGLDLAYFLVTRSSLTLSELIFALRSPASGLMLASDSISIPMTLALIAPGLALGITLELQRRRPRPLLTFQPSRSFRLGLLLWPAIGIACAVQAAIPARSPGLADNVFTAMPLQGTILAFRRELDRNKALHASARVPVLDETPVELAPTDRTQRLNVIIVMLESVRADATTVYSPELSTTPYLAQLARESLVVDDMYAVSPRSSAARTATLAGQYPATAEVEGKWAREPERRAFRTRLPALLRTQGYTSGYFSSATLDFENDRAIVEALGFDQMIVKEMLKPKGQTYLNVFGYEDREVLRPLRPWLDARAADRQPFLLTVVTNVGHNPYTAPPSVKRVVYPARNEQHQKYLNCVRYVDDFMRDLMVDLRKRNLLESSVVIVLGDHGEEFYEHGTYVRGQTLFNSVLHIPMLIRLPTAAHRVGHVSGLRQQIDVVPTVADALGFDLRGGTLPGRSMLSTPGHDVLFFNGHQPDTLLALRTADRKYIYDFESNAMSVYQVDREPGEVTDVHADIPPETLKQAETDLRSWQIRVRSTF